MKSGVVGYMEDGLREEDRGRGERGKIRMQYRYFGSCRLPDFVHIMPMPMLDALL